jgi:beta-xylosidase
MKILALVRGLVAASWLATHAAAANSTYYNPVLPGWHSDPSCISVEGILYCVTSTFIAFPGLPIYASNDLTNWKLIGHVWNRDSQIAGASWTITSAEHGMYAATIRHHNGSFYVICELLGTSNGTIGTLFSTTNIWDETKWSDAVRFSPPAIDPDLFWDDDGKVYMATETVNLQEIDLATGALTPPQVIWGGTGGVWPEGPHIYKKDGYYYLMIAEGGTATDHSITIARATNITGPYTSYAGNPILTNRNTDQYFSTVGHGDLFQDAAGNWWGMCLATRSGPQWQIYPMGRETVLFPVTWDEGEWPRLSPVRGIMNGWQLPATNRTLPGDGPFNQDPDVYDWNSTASVIPRNLIYWRVPAEGSITPTARGLQLIPSRASLTPQNSSVELMGQRGLTFIGRRQVDTLFNFTVDMTFSPAQNNQEAGVTVFLTGLNHIDLGIVKLSGVPTFRFHAIGSGPVPANITHPVPDAWVGRPITLEIRSISNTTYTFAAWPASDRSQRQEIASATSYLVSAGNGFESFTGSLLGVYATCNGAGNGTTCPCGGTAYVNRWRYTGTGQQIDFDTFVPQTGLPAHAA